MDGVTQHPTRAERRLALFAASLAAVFALALGAPLSALASPSANQMPGVQHLHFAAGPYTITPGANLILLDRHQIPKPAVDGYLVRMEPSLHYARPDGLCCGTVPRVDVIHLHHGVWLSNGAAGKGEGSSVGPFYPFMAAGEEKTIYSLPRGYGYPVAKNDVWLLNYMIHNLTATATKVYITYDLDFLPATAPSAANITPVHPVWMDVQAHHIYPVFDVKRGSGQHGRFTYPDMAPHAYPAGSAPLNEFTVDHPGTLVATAGHVHPGGLYDDLDLIRSGAQKTSSNPAGSLPNSVRLFRSRAHYFDPRGPISWDVAMTATAADWRPSVQPGDVLRVSATYETKRASWYESMGIMVVFMAWNDSSGANPFTQRINERDHVTHGHLAEDDHHGGTPRYTINVAKLPSCDTNLVRIGGFQYLPGDFTATGADRCAPTVRAGHSITFVNDDASPLSGGNPLAPTPAYLHSVFHTVTTCQNPCGLDTGISYPLANGRGNLDSTQLGSTTPASGNLSWATPAGLTPGTYTYFCRIHPFMRGVFRIIR